MTRPSGSKKKIALLGIAGCVIVVVLLVAPIGVMDMGKTSPVESTDLKDLVINESDLPSGWEVSKPFSRGSCSYPGNFTDGGDCTFNYTSSLGTGAFLYVRLFNYSSISQARYSIDSLYAALLKDPTHDQHEVVDIGDFAVREKQNSSIIAGYNRSTALWFQIGNYSGVLYLSYLHSYQNVDQSFTEIIQRQEHKISAVVG